MPRRVPSATDTDAYRPSGFSEPLDRQNRFLRLRAAFTARDARFAHPNAYGDALWSGVFDAAYTRPGDYLVQADGSLVHCGATTPIAGAVCADQPHCLVLAPGRAVQHRRQHIWWCITETNEVMLTHWPASVTRRGWPRSSQVPICQVTARSPTGPYCYR